MSWYNKVTADFSQIPDFLLYYENELEAARREIRIGGVIEKNVAALPGITEHRFNQLQEVEAVLNYLNIQLRKIKKEHFKKYMEGYNRALTSRDAEKYTEGEQDVIDMEVLINQIALLRNKFLGILKALESKNFMLGHLIKLRTAGMEDFTL